MKMNIPALKHTYLPGFCTRIYMLTVNMQLLWLTVTGRFTTYAELELLLNGLTTIRGQLSTAEQISADEMYQWFTYARDKCAIIMNTTRVEFLDD